MLKAFYIVMEILGQITRSYIQIGTFQTTHVITIIKSIIIIMCAKKHTEKIWP